MNQLLQRVPHELVRISYIQVRPDQDRRGPGFSGRDLVLLLQGELGRITRGDDQLPAVGEVHDVLRSEEHRGLVAVPPFARPAQRAGRGVQRYELAALLGGVAEYKPIAVDG